MAPAPSILHSLTVLATVRQEECGTAATSLELGLITAALVVSIVLSFFNTRRPTLARQPRNFAYSSVVIAVAICFTLAAFLIAISTLCLGWLRAISLDAVAGIVFALGPALVSIPKEVFPYSREKLASRLMLSHISLNIPTTHFQYIRLIKAGDTPDKHDSELRQFDGSNLLFIRHMLNSSQHGVCYSLFDEIWNCVNYPMSSERNRYVAHLQPLTKEDGLSTSEFHTVKGIRVNGILKEKFPNFAFVRDVDDGITSWWWSGVSSARHLITRPHRVHLDNGKRVGRALALLSDIISIGDLVLRFHLDTLKWMLQNDDDVRTAVISAPGLTCKLFIRELELTGWDAIGPEDLRPLPSEEQLLEGTYASNNSDETESLDRTKNTSEFPSQTACSISRSKYYALLFLILTEKSRRFLLPTVDKLDRMSSSSMVSPERETSGQYVLDALWDKKEASTAVFREIALKAVAKWLQGWGLEIAVVEEARRRTTSFDQKDRESSGHS